jgi:putative transposase
MSIAYLEAGLKFTMGGEEWDLTRKVTDTIWQITYLRTQRVDELAESAFLHKYANGEITLHGLPGQDLIESSERAADESLAHADEREREVALERRYYLQKLRDARLPAHTQTSMMPVIRAVYERLSNPWIPRMPDWTTVLRWKERYEKSGEDIGALMPRHKNKGRRPVPIPDDLERILISRVKTRYLTDRRPSKHAVLEEVNADVKAVNKTRPSSAQLPEATHQMLVRVIERTSAYDRCVARHGRAVAHSRYRSVLYKYDAARPLERVEMDHAKLNLFVIDERTGLPRGRPWLTACIDKATRCILGVHITFDQPGHMSVARCLQHAVLPKGDIKHELGLHNHWNCYGAPEVLCVDNGQEFHGRALEATAFHLGIDIDFMPRRTPWMKGCIERWFRSLDENLTDGAPGRTFSTIFDRGDYDPQRDAVVTMATLNYVVIRWIVDVYHQEIHSGLGKTPAAKWQELEPTIRRRLPVSAADLAPHLGKVDTRRLDHRGVTRDYLWYNSPELAEMRHRHGDTLKVQLRYDPDDLGSVVVFDPETEHPVEVPAIRLDYAKGLTEWQHRKIRKLAEAEGRNDHDPDTLLLVKQELRQRIKNDQAKARRNRRGKKKKVQSAQPGGEAGAAAQGTAKAARAQTSGPTGASSGRKRKARSGGSGSAKQQQAVAGSDGESSRQRGRVFDASPMPGVSRRSTDNDQS